MRTTFFLFAMLASVMASAQVTHVEPVSANYANNTVSFRVWWNAGSRDATHLSKVWVWVDYITVNSNNTTSGITWTRATAGTVSGGVTSYDGSNRNGFWLEGNSGSYSATITVQLTNVPAKFNWCAYVSDYPPNVKLENGTYTFNGTTDFIVSSHAQPITTKTIAKANLTVNSSSTFTDATDCPGIGSLYCPYTGSDLYMDATHLCQQRAGGAQNWEAWIRDTRDTELYRIVLMPDKKWWLAQNVKLASYGGSTVGSAISGCTKDECGRCYTWAQAYASYDSDTYGSSGNVQGICPFGWLLPVTSNYEAIVTAIGSIATALPALRALNATCKPIYDTYGFADVVGVYDCMNDGWSSAWYANDMYRENGFAIVWDPTGLKSCGYLHWKTSPGGQPVHIRCFRQL